MKEELFQQFLAAAPALELITQWDGGEYAFLVPPSGCFTTLLPGAGELPPVSELVDTPVLEAVRAPNGATGLVPDRSLAWTPLASRESTPHSLSPRLPQRATALVPAPHCSVLPQNDRPLAELCDDLQDMRALLVACRENEEAICEQSAPLEPELVCDLLRCAGVPASLSPDKTLLVRALFPSLRYLFRFSIAPRHIARAMEVFVFWLEALEELKPGPWFGNDVFALQKFSLPLVRAMVEADTPLTPFEVVGGDRFRFVEDIIRLEAGELIGTGALKAFRHMRFGALIALRELGQMLLEFDEESHRV